MSCGDDNPAQGWTDKHRRARKDHRCDACCETIRRGDIYCYMTGIWEDGPEAWKYCLRCEAVSNAISAHGEMPQMGLDCGHDWIEVFGAEPPPEVARLAFFTADEAQSLLGKTEDCNGG
jgi:hypothetical protein